MGIDFVNRFFTTLNAWLFRHRSALVILTSFLMIILLVFYLGWWETAAILFLKFGLGAKIAGAKTFTHAVIKAGGKKAIAAATAGMLAKRHIIDIISRFFAENSIKRYRRNLLLVIKMKIEEIKHSTLVKKLKALGSMLLSVPAIYFFWTKVLTAAIQKFVYALLLPLITLIWNLLASSLNFVSFILQILMLNIFLDTLKKYRWGKKIIGLVDGVIELIGKLLNLINKIFTLIGVDPRSKLIAFSNRFNRWLESILDRELSRIMKIQSHRDRYLNAVEALSEKRYLYRVSKSEKKISYTREVKRLFREKVLRERSWREIREERQKRWTAERSGSRSAIYRRVLSGRSRRSALLLPFHTAEISRKQALRDR